MLHPHHGGWSQAAGYVVFADRRGVLEGNKGGESPDCQVGQRRRCKVEELFVKLEELSKQEEVRDERTTRSICPQPTTSSHPSPTSHSSSMVMLTMADVVGTDVAFAQAYSPLCTVVRRKRCSSGCDIGESSPESNGVWSSSQRWICPQAGGKPVSLLRRWSAPFGNSTGN